MLLVAMDILAAVGATVSTWTFALAASILVANERNLVELAGMLVIPGGWAGGTRWLWVEAFVVPITAVGVKMVDNGNLVDKPLGVRVAAPVTAWALVEDALVDSWVALADDLVWRDHSNWDALLTNTAAILLAVVTWAGSGGLLLSCGLLGGVVLGGCFLGGVHWSRNRGADKACTIRRIQ